jgi:hypothetical protein
MSAVPLRLPEGTAGARKGALRRPVVPLRGAAGRRARPSGTAPDPEGAASRTAAVHGCRAAVSASWGVGPETR